LTLSGLLFGVNAWQMNGSPLPVSHGFPVRAVLPGIAGARWTKWLDRITISEHESPNFYQQRDYKILPPDIETKAQAAEAWCKFPAIQGMPINSVIAYPEAGLTIDLANGELEVCGYALPQGDDGPVVKVEVSSDKGETWAEADIVYPSKAELGTSEGVDKYKWAWAIWKYKLPKDKVRKITKDTVIWSRARDAGGNMQNGRRPWNYRGVAYDAYGETKGLQIEGVNQLTNGVRQLKI
jgi:sulfite oxidase